MKNIGLFLIAVGAALFIFIAYNMIKENNRVLSPIPEDKGVKVIFVTPNK